MNYISTRGEINPVGFSEAVMMGLARDGGLLIPSSIPDAGMHLGRWRKMTYTALAVEMMGLFTDLPAAKLKSIVDRSYAAFDTRDVTPVVAVGDLFVLELFHGPTLAFKDVALQFLGNVFEHILESSGKKLNILGATSGDTGSAAIHGIRARKSMRIFVMHPQGKISRTQERQMTSVLDDNVFNIAVDGTFDDCQGIMKALFCDLEFKDRYSLGSINSINWARVLAQVVYYFYGAFRVMDATGARALDCTVPTGNFGDIFAGYVAVKMGLPINRLILATNENDILSRFFNSGIYSVGKVQETLSPSMDIQVASNFERYLYYREGKDPARIRRMMNEFAKKGTLKVEKNPDGGIDPLIAAGSADTAATLSTIKQVYGTNGYIVDPHTAVGMAVARRHMTSGTPMMCLATAHPAKFGEAIRRAIAKDVAQHPVISALDGLPTRCDRLPASVPAVREYMAARIPEN
jgi:threonine synthase